MNNKKGVVIADQIGLIAQKQLTTSANFKQPRMLEILDTEDVYNFKLRPALQGRINIPFDGIVMAGFIDTMVAQVNKPPKVEFEDPNGANLKGSKKINSAWTLESKNMRLRMKDRAMKKIAAISGRAIAKYYADSSPDYKSHLDIVDYLDFHCEPNGGGHLDDHYFNWQENIFKTKEDLISGARTKFYDQAQVNRLIATYQAPDFKKNEDTYANKQNRYTTLGLDMESHNYVGGALYNLVDGFTYYDGVKYHVIYEKFTGIWLRCVLLKEDFGNDKTMFLSYASPQEDAFNFWNRGPGDQIKPIAEAIRVNLNEVLNNNRKRNWDMKAVDGSMFNIKDLDWQQDKVIAANVPLGQSIQNGIYRFETPEIAGALDLNTYLNNMAGEKLGVNSQTQGQGSEELATIYKGNEFNTSKRMKLISDSYDEFYEDLGTRFDWGLYDHADQKYMVKLISADGVGWENITDEDKDPDYTVSVISSTSEMAQTEDEKRNQIDLLRTIEADPEQKALINKKALVEEKLRLGGFNDEKLRKLMDVRADATDDIISEAKKAIELMVEGKEPRINQSATTGFLQYISDWLLDNSDDISEEVSAIINEYFETHVPIATRNAEKKQFNDELLAGVPIVDPKAPGQITPTGANLPPTNPVI